MRHEFRYVDNGRKFSLLWPNQIILCHNKIIKNPDHFLFSLQTLDVGMFIKKMKMIGCGILIHNPMVYLD